MVHGLGVLEVNHVIEFLVVEDEETILPNDDPHSASELFEDTTRWVSQSARRTRWKRHVNPGDMIEAVVTLKDNARIRTLVLRTLDGTQVQVHANSTVIVVMNEFKTSQLITVEDNPLKFRFVICRADGRAGDIGLVQATFEGLEEMPTPECAPGCVIGFKTPYRVRL